MNTKEIQDNILIGPYTLYGQKVMFNNLTTRDIVNSREWIGDAPLYPQKGKLEFDHSSKNFLTPTWTKEHKSSTNASSIDYNRWQVFVAGKSNPVTAFEFMDDLLGK